MDSEVSRDLQCCRDIESRDLKKHSKCACHHSLSSSTASSPKTSSFRLPPRLVSMCMFVILLSVICVAAFKQLSAAPKKPSGGKGLEFLRVHKGSDDDDHDHRLKKSDPFIDGFVPTEYTDYLAMKPKELLAKQAEQAIRPRRTRAVDSSDTFNEVYQISNNDNSNNDVDVHNNNNNNDVVVITKASTSVNQETSAAHNETSNSIEIEPAPEDHLEVEDPEENEIETDNEESYSDTNNHTTNHEEESNNDIEPANTNGGAIEVTTSTETTAAATTLSSTTTATTRPVTEDSHANGDSGDEVSLEILREKLKFLESRMGLDAEVLVALNKTLTIPQTRQKIYQLFLNLVTKLEEKELGVAATQRTTTTASNPVVTSTSENVPTSEVVVDIDGNRIVDATSRKPTLICGDTQQFKIFPHDTPQIVRKKQGNLMRCYMDESVDPCDRFYDYACGKWGNFHPIPKDKGGYDIFEILREDMDAKLIQMLEAPIDESDGNSTAAVKALYTSCMNTEIIESRKETPLLKLLRQLGGWPVVDGDTWNEEGFDWQKTITKLREYNNDILVALWVGPDGKDSDDYIVQFDQSDLLLPSAEYYLLGLGHPIMQTYYNLLVNVATLLGADRNRAKREMKELIEFEIELAAIMIPPHERRNYSEIYLKLDLGKLSAEIPDFDFSAYLSHLLHRPLNTSEEVVIYALPYFKQLTKLMKNSNKRTISNYVLWRFIRHRINNLDTRFLKAQQELYRRLYGREETPPRKKFCVAYVNGNLGNSVGALFVKKYFDEQSKGDMEALTDQVQLAFHDLVMIGGWLSNDTKKLAESKIRAIIHNIGYPDYILDDKLLQDEFFGLTYQKDEFFENVLKNLRGRTIKEMRQLDEKVNRTLWTTTPAVVNAYYSRNRNQIMFPAGILQPPFYHKFFPKSLNFGGIGVVIGHEITHGFDDKGRQFDHIGNINQWWDHTSSVKFQEKAQCIIDQYNNFNVEEVGIFLNGLNTQGENIADNGGLKQSYHAYQNWLNENELRTEGPLPGLEHLSDQQLFFLNFAQVWCGSTRPEALRSKIKTAVHAPGKYRVFGTLSNSEEFARAFNCPKGSPMNPESKCSVW